jgi:hypothetical protein
LGIIKSNFDFPELWPKFDYELLVLILNVYITINPCEEITIVGQSSCMSLPDLQASKVGYFHVFISCRFLAGLGKGSCRVLSGLWSWKKKVIHAGIEGIVSEYELCVLFVLNEGKTTEKFGEENGSP